MKEVISTARNLLAAPKQGGGVQPIVEAVITVTEWVYRFTDDELRQSHETETYRIHASPEMLRAMASTFVGWADEAEEFVEGLKDARPD